jgi:hypothetical protein
MKKIILTALLLQSMFVMHSKGQSTADSLTITTKPAPEKNELKYNLNESGTHYFKATFLNQTWLRYNQSNPGTIVIERTC